MSTLALFLPLYFTMAALFLGAIETSLFPHLGIPALFTPDLNLALITFLASRPFRARTLLAVIGVSVAASLNNSLPGITQPGIILFIFFIGKHLNQTIFMNNIFPQAFFTGCSSLVMTLLMGVLAAPQPALLNTVMIATGCALTTALFAFPILSYLNALQERFQPLNPDSITS